MAARRSGSVYNDDDEPATAAAVAVHPSHCVLCALSPDLFSGLVHRVSYSFNLALHSGLVLMRKTTAQSSPDLIPITASLGICCC